MLDQSAEPIPVLSLGVSPAPNDGFRRGAPVGSALLDVGVAEIGGGSGDNNEEIVDLRIDVAGGGETESTTGDAVGLWVSGDKDTLCTWTGGGDATRFGVSGDRMDEME